MLAVMFSSLYVYGQGACFPAGISQTTTSTLNNSTVRVLSFANIRVCTEPASGTPCTPLTNIYTTPALSTPLANPFQADQYGNFHFCVSSPSTVHIQISAPQVTTQDIPNVTLGVGGGGGGTSPCGVLYDVQINDPLGTFGCDTGIFTENPGTHTVSDTIVQATQQFQNPTTTATWFEILGFSNGSTITHTVKESLDPNTSESWGWDRPPTGPHGAGKIMTSTGVQDSNGNDEMHWSGSVSGLVSQEFMRPVFYTNAPSPTTSNDLVDTLFPQNASTQFMGPLPNQAPGPYIRQSNTCHGTGTTATCSLLGPSLPGDAYAFVVGGGGTTGSLTDSEGNTFTDVWGPGATFAAGYAPNIIGSSISTPINTFTQTVGGPVWEMIVAEVGDVPASPLETSVHTGTGCSGNTLSFATVTTAATDLIVGVNYNWPFDYTFTPIYTEISPWYIDGQRSTPGGGPTIAMVDSLQSAGTITPQVTMTPCTEETVTMAFKTGTNNTWNLPRFRYPVISDFVQQGLIPDPSAVATGSVLGWNGYNGFQWFNAYQTVQANGSAETQRQILNLKSGSGATVSCVDNSGSGSTDCTVAATGSGGSVTSVAMTGDGTVFNSSVSGSPITTSGTLAPSLHTQSANTVLAGPTSGGAVAPTFRSLVNADLPAANFLSTFPAIATVQTFASLAPYAVTFPANFSTPTAAAHCGTNPSGNVTFTLTDVTSSTTIGTVIISSSCGTTFATTGGTTQTMAANDLYTVVSGTDAVGANIVIDFRATRN